MQQHIKEREETNKADYDRRQHLVVNHDEGASRCFKRPSTLSDTSWENRKEPIRTAPSSGVLGGEEDEHRSAQGEVSNKLLASRQGGPRDFYSHQRQCGFQEEEQVAAVRM